jgi:predicted GNAT family acetyltransferase/uncharacterized protein YbjT (DUF2867 family)
MDIGHEEHGSKGVFFIVKDGVRAAEMTYSRAGDGLIVIDHTEVSDALRGTGAGKRLVEAGAAWAREQQVRVIPLCPFAAAMFAKDETLRDVLAGSGKLSVLVVGATGRLGGKIVREIAALGRTRIRATHRPGSKPEALAALTSAGAELVEADLGDEAALDRACRGVHVVVSALQGLRDVIVDGQTRVLRAAEKARVMRMIPSDYSVDFYATNEGQNRNLDLRREFNRVLDRSSVRGTSVLCGAFMDLLARPGAMGPDANGAMRFWGDEDQPYDFTTMDDTARYVAAALDGKGGRVLRVAGDTQSPRQLAAIFEEVRGTPVKLVRAGSLDDLDALIDRMRAADEAPASVFPAWQQLQYARDMASGRGQLRPVENALYLGVKPMTVRDLLASGPLRS